MRRHTGFRGVGDIDTTGVVTDWFADHPRVADFFADHPRLTDFITDRRDLRGLGKRRTGFRGIGDMSEADVAAYSAWIGADPTDTVDMSNTGAVPAPSSPSFNPLSLLPGIFATAEKIGLQQTVPAGTYIRNADGSIMYQQPTGASGSLLSLPGLTGSNGIMWVILGGGALLAVAAFAGKR